MRWIEPLPSNNQLAGINKAGLLLFAALLGAVGCTRPQAPAKSQQTAPARASKDDDVFICPDGDIQKTGSNDHKVTLSWTPAHRTRLLSFAIASTEPKNIGSKNQRTDFPPTGVHAGTARVSTTQRYRTRTTSTLRFKTVPATAMSPSQCRLAAPPSAIFRTRWRQTFRRTQNQHPRRSLRANFAIVN
jgi:hypothetical protein